MKLQIKTEMRDKENEGPKRLLTETVPLKDRIHAMHVQYFREECFRQWKAWVDEVWEERVRQGKVEHQT